MNSLKKVTQKGFTIVELLIVIVVIGILAALVITTYNGIQQKGRNTERQTDLKAIQGQLEAYYAQNGRYPTLTNLNDNPDSNTGFIKTEMKGLDAEALRDPKAAAGAFVLNGTADASHYAYAVTQDDGTSACDNTTTDCTKYTLTAKQEGSTTDIVLKSLN